MIELRFHRQIYRGTAVDEAVKRFAAHAEFELREEPDYWIVRLTAREAGREKKIAGELGNWALGLTVETKGR